MSFGWDSSIFCNCSNMARVSWVTAVLPLAMSTWRRTASSETVPMASMILVYSSRRSWINALRPAFSFARSWLTWSRRCFAKCRYSVIRSLGSCKLRTWLASSVVRKSRLDCPSAWNGPTPRKAAQKLSTHADTIAVRIDPSLPLTHDALQQVVVHFRNSVADLFERAAVHLAHSLSQPFDTAEKLARAQLGLFEELGTLTRIFAGIGKRLVGQLDRIAHFLELILRPVVIARIIVVARRVQGHVGIVQRTLAALFEIRLGLDGGQIE